MDCKSIQEKLSAYIDNQLSAEEKALVDEHLKACSECKNAFEDLKKTIAHTQGLEELEPPPWLTQKVMARVREEAGRKKGFLQKLFFPLHIKVPIEVIATLAVVVTAFYIFKTIEPEIKQTASAPEQSIAKEAPSEAAPGKKKRSVRESDILTEKVKGAVDSAEEEIIRRRAPEDPEKDVKKEMRAFAPRAMETAEMKKQVMSLTVYIKDAVIMNKEIEKILKKLEGEILRSESFDNKYFFNVRLNSNKVKELKEKLKLIGEVEEKVASSALEGDVEINIKIVRTGASLR